MQSHDYERDHIMNEAQGPAQEVGFHDTAASQNLQADKGIPTIHISPLIDEVTERRGRSTGQDDSVQLPLMQHPPSSASAAEVVHQSSSGLKLRKSSPSPSRSGNLLQRFGSFRDHVAPLRTRFSTRRAQGRQYDTLDESDEEGTPEVDLSTLANDYGYQLTDLSEIQTEYHSPSTVALMAGSYSRDPLNPELDASGLGKGMVVGAHLKLDPASTEVRRALSTRLSPNGDTSDTLKRAKTIRDLGQDLAQKRQAIVEVHEAFDLGSLEGAEIERQVRKRSSHASFDELEQESRTKSSPYGPTSYFYPTDPEHPDWKPFAMSSIFILMLTGVSLGMAIFQEWLCRHSIALAKDKKGILEFDEVANVPLGYFFAWKYFPTLIFVAYGVLWSIMDYDIKRLEPFYQLSQPHGSSAAASLNLDHLTAWTYFVPFNAIRLRQWAVFVSSIGNILATSVAPSLQNPSVILVQNSDCPHGHCPPGQNLYYVRISPGWSRALTSSLVVTAALGIVLFVQLRRKSGLLSDPKSIAGIAAMATKSHILNDFQGMDIATRGAIHKKLQHRQYVLYKSSIWQGEWKQETNPSPDSLRKAEATHPLMLRLKAGMVFVSFMLLVLIAIPVMNFTSLRAVPNALPWFPVLLATVIKMMWTTFDNDVRLLEPFYILSKGNAPPQQSITLDYRGSMYGWFPIKALFNRHYIVALVGFSSVLLDVLTVTVSSFAVNSAAFLHKSGSKDISNQAETFISFWGSVVLSISILAFVIVSAVLVYARRRHPFLPREPSTIAAILAFIYSSNMLIDFVDTERFTHRQMEAYLKNKRTADGQLKRYGLGWFRGRDGRVHCAIDEEPMRSRYQHGKPYYMAQAPWDDRYDPNAV